MKKLAVALAAAAVAALAVPAAADEKPAMAPKVPVAQAPDLAFQEVQVHYKDLNVSFKLWPAGSPSTTSVLRLVENPSVAPGTKLGPDEPSGASGPIATKSCEARLVANLRVWVKNGGNKSFDATTPGLGLTGNVDGTPATKAFGKVDPGATSYFEAGALALLPGWHSTHLVLNADKGQGETSFANNVFDARFQITCEKRRPAPPTAPK